MVLHFRHTFRAQPKKKAKGDPAALQLTGESLQNFVGEEAPVARAGPRSPDVFYRGEEAGAAPNPTVHNESVNDKLNIQHFYPALFGGIDSNYFFPGF